MGNSCSNTAKQEPGGAVHYPPLEQQHQQAKSSSVEHEDRIFAPLSLGGNTLEVRGPASSHQKEKYIS
eukprot:1159053-Pelagomonas_calceolata.AAC.2